MSARTAVVRGAVALLCLALACSSRPEQRAQAAPVENGGTPVLEGYPDAPGSHEALAEFLEAQDAKAPEARLAEMLRLAAKPVGVKVFEAELARRAAAPADVSSLIATIRAKAPGTPLASSALAAELKGLRGGDPAGLLARCREILEAADSSDGDKAVALYTRLGHYRENGQAKPAALDALRFWSAYPDKVARMKAEASLAAALSEAGYRQEADMLETSPEAPSVAAALHAQFAPLRDALEGATPPSEADPRLVAYVTNAPNTAAVTAQASPDNAAPSTEQAQYLARLQRLVAYEGDLDAAVAFSLRYAETLQACLNEAAPAGDTLCLTFAQVRSATECLRKLLADPHFVRSRGNGAGRSSASVRSEQVLSGLSALSLDIAERRFADGHTDEPALADAYRQHTTALQTVNDTDGVIKAYRRFVEAHPQAAAAPDFVTNIAEVYRSLNALGSAAETFKEVCDRYPDCPGAVAARVNRIVCLYQDAAYEDAYQEAGAFCDTLPNDPGTPGVLLLRGMSESSLGLEEEASATMKEVLKRFPASPIAPRAALWLAGRALAAQEYDEARRLLGDLVERYPGSEAAGKAAEYLAGLNGVPDNGR